MMKRLFSMMLLSFLGVTLFGCDKTNSYDFVYELSKYNYDELIDVDFEYIDRIRYVKYELKKEGFLESLILTVETIYSPTMKKEQNITLTEEGVLYEIPNDVGSDGLSASVIGCLGTLYTNHFESVYGVSLNKAKSDVEALNESFEAYNDKVFYTVEIELKVLNVRLTSQLGFRSDPFYYYVLTPYDRVAYSVQEDSEQFMKKYQDAYRNTTTYLSLSEMLEELGIGESNVFGFPETLGVYQDQDHVFHVIGVLKDLNDGFFPEEIFEEISEYSEFKMSIEFISENEMKLDFDILDEDVEYNFVFEYDFTRFGDIDYLFEGIVD